MVPSPEICFAYDFWYGDPPETVELTCLLPTGITMSLEINRNATLQEVKEEIWELAEQMPLYAMLRDKSMYALCSISGFSGTDELTDETKRLCDVRPNFCILRITEKEVATSNKIIKNITNLIGKSLNDFKELKNPEVQDFRYKMALLAKKRSHGRKKMTWNEKLMYQFPPRVASIPEIPETVKSRLRKDRVISKISEGASISEIPETVNGDLRKDIDAPEIPKVVLVAKFENNDTAFTFEVPISITPSALLVKVLQKRAINFNNRYGKPSEYILKICGQDEYIYGEYPLIQFLYIQDTLSRDAVPTVVAQCINNIKVFEDYEYQEIYDDKQRNESISQMCSLRKKSKHISSWEINENFHCKVQKITGLNCDTSHTVEVGIQVGLFHGDKSLCEPKETAITKLNDTTAIFNETLMFDIKLYNVPRMARICLVVYETTKSSKSVVRCRRFKNTQRDRYIIPLAWVNTAVFDYKNQLKTGLIKLYTWTHAEDSNSDDFLHPLGTVESNPRSDDCATVHLLMHTYDQPLYTILYPQPFEVLDYANQLEKRDKLYRGGAEDDRSIKDIILPYMNNGRFHEMHEQERNAIWNKRYNLMNENAEALPCLVSSVEWNDRNEVAEMTKILQKWPSIKLERSLELLDYAYADHSVRGFAVKRLQLEKDEDLLLYLLQLIQAVKHESYINCDLVEFLLERALKNQRIGHFLFWHLKSEMQVPSMQIRFGLMLEAYLKGSQEHIPILLKQMTCLDILKTGSEIAKKYGKDKKGRIMLREFLENTYTNQTISDVISPLNSSFRCKSVRYEKCKVMDSKMRPLWIVFENADMHGDDIDIIFKNGDDLRQDMLTLQMLRVIDRIWKSHGHDFRMNPYGCISMERRLGMIEVILNANTIANIQKEKAIFSATSPFNKESLYLWLKDHNTTDDLLQKAIHEFTLSCAGYCVVTYVLGVADRHSDNIMLKKSGQLFHIDFGHILGNFKEKFGIKRERVPFVLTCDFVHVIDNGNKMKVKEFQSLCEEAFLILRQHGSLILSLFAMMISTGLPELSSEKDLNYLRETLVLDLPENEARVHFQSKFNEALRNSWKTSLNWASHNFAKNNKQ